MLPAPVFRRICANNPNFRQTVDSFADTRRKMSKNIQKSAAKGMERQVSDEWEEQK